jgi:hypothetical protein
MVLTWFLDSSLNFQLVYVYYCICIDYFADIKRDSVKIVDVIYIDSFGILANILGSFLLKNSFHWISRNFPMSSFSCKIGTGVRLTPQI